MAFGIFVRVGEPSKNATVSWCQDQTYQVGYSGAEIFFNTARQPLPDQTLVKIPTLHNGHLGSHSAVALEVLENFDKGSQTAGISTMSRGTYVSVM